jgi:hypothetical protein
MIEALSTRTADIFVDCLSDSGPEAIAKKAVRAFRANPCDELAKTALSYVNGLPGNKVTELKQAAGL